MNEICGNVRKFAPKFEIEYSMKRIFQVFFSMLVVALAFTSCLKSDNDTVTLYDDIAIMEFKLGTLNRYLHTTSSIHTDSIYKVTYSASNYVMNIDQINHKIYNTDSLLVGTDISRVVCTVTTENSGVVYVKSLTSDSLTYLRSDSIDFTEPRIFRVYASDGSCSRDYTVSLNVRTVEKGTFYWTETSKELFPTTDVEQPNWAEELMDSTDADMVPYAVLGYIRWECWSSGGKLSTTIVPANGRICLGQRTTVTICPTWTGWNWCILRIVYWPSEAMVKYIKAVTRELRGKRAIPLSIQKGSTSRRHSR